MNFILVGIFAGIGALIRRNWTVFFKKKISTSESFLATLILNIVGFSLILFFYLSLDIRSMTYLILTTGLLGGLTTFSTFNSELINLWFSKRYRATTLYLFGTYLIALIIIVLVSLF